ncbi:hypothetical protein ABPG74_012078 [Tetrahymena malaccensis]
MDGCEVCQKNKIGFETCQKCQNKYTYFEQTNTCIKMQCEQDQFLTVNNQNQEKCVSVCPNGFVKNFGSQICQAVDICSLEYFQNSQISNNRMALNAFIQADGMILIFYSNFINVVNAENGSFVRQMQFESHIILIKYVNQKIYLFSDQNKVFMWDQVYQQNVLCSVIQNGAISAQSDILLVSNNQSRSFVSSYLSLQKKIILTEIDPSLTFNQIEISFENQALIFDSYIVQFNYNSQILISYLIENNLGEISLSQFNSQYTCLININSIIQIEKIQINSETTFLILFEDQQAIFLVKKDSCEQIKPSQLILRKIQLRQSCITSAVDCQYNYLIYALSQNNNIILIDLIQQKMISQWPLSLQIQDFTVIQFENLELIFVLSNQILQTYSIDSQNFTQLSLFNQYQVYINYPVKLIQLIDSQENNYLCVLSDQIQILNLSLNKTLFSTWYSEFEYYNSDQITQIAISDDNLFLAACDISGKVVVWYAIIPYQPKFLYQIKSINEQCIQLLIFNSAALIVKFQSYIIIQNLYNQFMITQMQINNQSFSKILISQNYIYLVYNLQISLYSEQQAEVAKCVFKSDFQDVQVSSYDKIFVVDSNNTIQSYLYNTQLVQIMKTEYNYQLIFSFDKMFLFNYPSQNEVIILNDKNNQISIFNSTLGVIQKNSQQQGIVQDITILDQNLFLMLFQSQSQQFGFSNWIDFLQIQSDKIVQKLMARFSKLLTIQSLQKKINQYNQTHYYALGVLTQSISYTDVGDWILETNTVKYSYSTYFQGGVVVKVIQDKQNTLSFAGTVNGYFQCIPMNEVNPTKNVYQLQKNELNNDEIQFIKITFYYSAFYIIQKTKIQVFDLFTNQFIKLIQFESESEIPKIEEIILDFQVYEDLGIFLTYNSKQIILQDLINNNLYTITNDQFFNSIAQIQGCLLDENLQKIYFYGKTIMQANLDLSDLQTKSPQNHYDFEICLFLKKQGALVYNFDGALLASFDTQSEKIFQLDICSSYLILYTPSVAYVISRQQLETVKKIILSDQQFVKGFCFSSINLIAYSTSSIATSQFTLFSLTYLQQKGVFKSSYINNLLGKVVNIMYDQDNNLLHFLDTFGNSQLIQFDLLFVTKSQLINEEIAKQVNDPPIGNLIDFNMNEVFIHNQMNVWRFSYNILTQNYYRAYENEFQYYILVNEKSSQENSLLICDKNQNLFLYYQQQMAFIQGFQDTIIDMKKLKQSNQNIYLFIFQSYMNVVIGNSINFLNNFKISYSLTSIQFKKFLLVDENVVIFQTQDNQFIDYDFINKKAIYTNQFNQKALVVSSMNLQYTNTNNQEQNILFLSLSTGEIVKYNILIKQSQIVQPYQVNNYVYQFIQKDNTTLILIMKLGNIIQVDISTMKEQDDQIYNQNAQGINQSVEQTKSSDILLFQFDQFHQRYFISISYEKKLGVFNLLTNQFIKYLTFPDQFMKKLYLNGQHLVLGCSFQLNFYNVTNLQFIQRYRKSNYQFQIQQFLQIDNNSYAISYQTGIELIAIDSQNQIKQIYFKALTYPNIVSINYMNIGNSYQILSITQNGVYDYRLSQDQLNSLFINSYSNQNARQQCYFNFPFQNSFQTENKLDQLFNANSQNNIQFTFNVGVNKELQFGNILSRNQNQTNVVFNPNSVNSSLLFLNQNSFKYLNIDVNLINFQLQFQEQEYQQMTFSQITQNINFQSISIINQNVSFGNQIFFEQKNSVKLVDFEIKNVNFTNTQRQLLLTQSKQYNPTGLLRFKGIQYVLIDQMRIDNINVLSDNFILIEAETIQTLIIKSLIISNSFIIGNFLYLMGVQNLKIETFQIENCSQAYSQSLEVFNQFYLIQLLGIQQALINNFISTQNQQIQLLRSVNQFQTDNFIRNLNDDVLVIQNVLVYQNTFNFQQQSKDQINIFQLQNNNVTLKNIQFIQNEGNIFILQSQNVLIDTSYFYKNQGVNGACLLLQNLKIVSINDTHFIQNNALASGGSIFCQDIFQLQTNQLTTFKNNSAQIGGAIRLSISNSQNMIYLNQMNSIEAQFEGNIGQIYGNNIGKYPERFQILDSKFNVLIEGDLFNEDTSHSMFSVTDVKSGDYFYLQIRLYDDKGSILKIDQNKISNNTYNPNIVKELEQYIFEIQDPTNYVDVRQQSIITYLQYNSTTLSFNFQNIILAAFPNKTTNSTNLELKVVPWQTRQSLNIQISFRNCKVGEAFQQISSQIIQCQKCSEGMYSVAQPKLNLQDLSQNQCKKCPIGVDSCHSNVLIVSKGFWRENEESDIIIQCNKYNPNVCDSQNFQSIQGCIEGYIGPLCETCDIFSQIWKNGYYANTLKKNYCQKCENLVLNLNDECYPNQLNMLQ